jgi:undecaprenyl phosphate N,N'-diacetylbacillosamine 1-phosphate transferase
MYNALKRLADIVVSFIMILLLLPIMGLIGLILAIQLKKSPFFIQSRPGKDEVVFKIIKFQTMIDKRDENGQLLSDHLRIIPFGKLLRKSSLDELPQLFNVLIGNMSFVGPRPLLVEYLNFYSKEQRQRHLVRPGITGLAQIKGRNAITWEEKFKYDIYYAQKFSFLLDFKILLNTVLKVIYAKDIQSSENTTMKRFEG